LYSYW